MTSIGTARAVPHAPQIHVHNSTPRNTASALMRSALPISAGVSSQPSSDVDQNSAARHLERLCDATALDQPDDE